MRGIILCFGYLIKQFMQIKIICLRNYMVAFLLSNRDYFLLCPKKMRPYLIFWNRVDTFKKTDFRIVESKGRQSSQPFPQPLTARLQHGDIGADRVCHP